MDTMERGGGEHNAIFILLFRSPWVHIFYSVHTHFMNDYLLLRAAHNQPKQTWNSSDWQATWSRFDFINESNAADLACFGNLTRINLLEARIPLVHIIWHLVLPKGGGRLRLQCSSLLADIALPPCATPSSNPFKTFSPKEIYFS